MLLDWGGCLEAEVLGARETDAGVLFGKLYEGASRDEDPFGNELLAA